MILRKLRQSLIFNTVILLYIFTCSNCCYAQESYTEKISKPKIVISEVITSADSNFAKATKNTSINNDILNNARDQYYLVTTVDKGNIHSIIQLARIYDLQDNEKYAKAYFSRALAINYKNIDANYYFGNFFYTRKKYKKALKLYRYAFEYGMKENSDNLKKMADIYEKLGDLARANTYYKKLFLTNPQDEQTPEKIRELEKIKYQNTGYYKRSNK